MVLGAYPTVVAMMVAGCVSHRPLPLQPFDPARPRVRVVATTDLFELIHWSRILESAIALSRSLTVAEPAGTADYSVEIVPAIHTRDASMLIQLELRSENLGTSRSHPVTRVHVSCRRDRMLSCAQSAVQRIEELVAGSAQRHRDR